MRKRRPTGRERGHGRLRVGSIIVGILLLLVLVVVLIPIPDRGWPTQNEEVCIARREAARSERIDHEGRFRADFLRDLRSLADEAEPSMRDLISRMHEAKEPLRVAELDGWIGGMCSAELRIWYRRQN